MSALLAPLTSSLLAVPHGFFTREGGVSAAPYDTLNGGIHTQDKPEAVSENRRRMAETLGVEAENFPALLQVHGTTVVVVGAEDPLWESAQPPKADAMISVSPAIAATIATADCVPVLMSSEDGKIVAAVHAGWRGAVAGVLEATVTAMQKLGAQSLHAVVGPCISLQSYETGPDMRAQVLAAYPDAERFFQISGRQDHYHFDLPMFCLWRLRQVGVGQVENLAVDTLTDSRFFSYRRATLAGVTETGRQISAIRPR